MFKRPQYQILKKRMKEPRKFLQVIIGPRQVGKTTLIKQYLEDTSLPFHFVSADNIPAENTSWIDQQWDTARLKKEALKTKEYLLVIDEIQKLSNWSEAIKNHWDSDTFNDINIKVVILGSSSLFLQKGLSESLAGRFELIQLNHWSYSEMHNAFGIIPDTFVWFGGYPGAVHLLKDEERWKEYIKNALIETTISKDILMMTRIDKPALLKRLFELSCLYSGQILSYTKMLGQLHDAGNTTTLSHYLNLLDSAGLICGLEKFALKNIRQRASSPKLLVQNTSFISALRDENFEQIRTQPDKWGRMVESAIGAHLINSSKQGRFKLFYWRDRNNEIDFVLKRKDKIIGLEIKSGYGKKTTGMNEFQKRFNPDKLLLIGSSGLPWQDFLLMDPELIFN